MDRLNIGRISSKKMDMLQDLSVDFSQLVKKYIKNLKKLSPKEQKAFGKLFGDFKDGLDDLSTNESVNEAKYNTKQDAMNAYMKGKVSAKELDKIAKNDFNSSVATKKELQNFLDSGYMKTLMANTYGLKVPAMEKKVKELMVFAEGTLKEDIQYFESVNEAKYHKSKDGAGARKAEAIHNNAYSIIDMVMDEKRDAKEVVGTMGPALINSIKATLKHKFKPMSGREEDLKSFYNELKELLKVAESLVKRPSKAGVKKLKEAHREWWNWNFGADIVLNGKFRDSLVELNEAEEPKIISDLRDVMKSGYKSVKDPVSGKKMKVDSYSASAVIAVYDALRKPDVKAKFASQPLPKMVNVAFKVAKK